jgi:hypothetical protein
METTVKGGLGFALDARWTRKGRDVVGAWVLASAERICVGYGAVPTPDIFFEKALGKARDLHANVSEIVPVALHIHVGPDSGFQALMRRDRSRGYIDRRIGLPHSSFVHKLRSLEHQRRLYVLREMEMEPVLTAHLKAYAEAAARVLPAYPRTATQDEWAEVFSEVQGSTDFVELRAFMTVHKNYPEAITAH